MAQNSKESFQFTPENLLENIHKVGGWSIYGLASEALEHYFPDEYKDGTCDSLTESKLLRSMGFSTWDEVVTKYHEEVGYQADGAFNPRAVNEN